MIFRALRTNILLILFLTISSMGICAEKMTLRLLIWEGYAPESQLEKFKTHVKKTFDVDLKVEVKFAEETKEFYTGIVNKTADIITPPGNFPKSERFPLIQKHYVLPINLDNIPNYKHIVKTMQKAEYISHNWKVYGVPIAHGPYGLIYNTKHFDKAPDSWSVLWDPKYKGKYSISADQYEANIYTTALSLGLQGEELQDLGKIRTNKFQNMLKSLVKNAANHWVAVDSAEKLKGLHLATSWGDSLTGLKKLGEDWKFAEPKEGTTGWLDNLLIGYSLKDKPKLKRIAEEWLNWCISEQFQINVIVRELSNDPVNLSIKDKLTPAEIKTHHLDDPDYFLTKRILWPTLDIRTQNGLELIWLTCQSPSKK